MRVSQRLERGNIEILKIKNKTIKRLMQETKKKRKERKCVGVELGKGVKGMLLTNEQKIENENKYFLMLLN